MKYLVAKICIQIIYYTHKIALFLLLIAFSILIGLDSVNSKLDKESLKLKLQKKMKIDMKNKR